MRFAVSLLMFICVASVVGTVLQQNRSSSNYIDQFGPFWYEVFDKFSIWHVYNSWWFLLIMAFLVVSTTVCLIRNAPKMLRDARSFREHVRASSLRAFPHRVESQEPTDVPSTVTGLKTLLGRFGYAVRERQDGDGVLLAAKKGSANRLGYVFAHAAMVIICIGGLLDSELPVRLQVMFGGKKPIVENMLISEVPESGRLSVNNPSFRASVLVPRTARPPPPWSWWATARWCSPCPSRSSSRNSSSITTPPACPAASPAKWWSPIPTPARASSPPSRSMSRCASRA